MKKAATPRRMLRPVTLALAVLSTGLLTLSAHAQVPEAASTVCASCHGLDGNSAVAMFPKLAGQQAGYISRQLADFKSGKRKNDIMAPMTASLSPEDMKALGQYFASQKPQPSPVDDKSLVATGEKIYNDGNPDSGVPACASCHKDNGVGDSRYPRLASQHAGYLVQQLNEFKSGQRNNDKLKVMQAVAQRMNDAEIRAVSEFLAGQ